MHEVQQTTFKSPSSNCLERKNKRTKQKHKDKIRTNSNREEEGHNHVEDEGHVDSKT